MTSITAVPTALGLTLFYYAPPDTRKVVGGFVWAKAAAVSHDSKRIYGQLLDDTWLRGTILEVSSSKASVASRRSTTYIKRA